MVRQPFFDVGFRVVFQQTPVASFHTRKDRVLNTPGDEPPARGDAPRERDFEQGHAPTRIVVRDGFESPHLPFALACRLMRDLGSIVFVLPSLPR